jgi:integrase/recombinase XerD
MGQGYSAKQYTRIKTATRLVNRVLKEIGKTLEIETPLTTYVAQGTSSAIIKEMMGHTKEETTEIYLKGFENKILDDASELLNLK